MPIYNFRNKETGEEYEKFLSISAREDYLKENPNVETMISGAPGFSDPFRLGIRKADASFRDLLGNIKRQHLRSTINRD